MPGILPMKVIRVGSSAQSRIAQACDRCRSKKIRCDGIRPCCTQCAGVGFECKTSDKLSRRAFPRGYTESLEDRVRGLEAEVRELKDLLDEKDEKIDVLSRIHSFSPPSRKCSTSLSPTRSESVRAELTAGAEEYVDVDTSAIASSDPFSSGVSTTAALIESFNHKVQDSEKSCPKIDPSKFAEPSRSLQSSTKGASKIPPRLLSDQYINIFFQEWAPLLPILHRPSFLRTYEDFLADPDAAHWHSNKQAVAQLFLIFEISALSSVSRIKQSTTSYEHIWRKALHAVSSTPSIASLQCHVLAQLCYLLRAEYTHLARHRAVGVSMCHQLSLHQNRKRCAASPLETETMKRVFWCQYALDKFASVASGTPTLLRERDITAEYPRDVDDENVSPQGFSPALPGELTKMSGALALFKASRILAKVLEELYPSSTDYRLPIKRVHELSEELERWSQNLPKHLRLLFANDKPSTGTIGCRSPLLSLAYFFIRSLIHRPIVCYGQNGSASASTIALAESAKHTVQILELLDERRMSYTFPFSKSELLLVSGFSMLWQCLDLPKESKLLKDNQKSLSSLLEVLSHDSSEVSAEFQNVASDFVAISRPSSPVPAPKPVHVESKAARQVSSTMPAPDTKPKSPRKQLQAIASRFSAFNTKVKLEDAPRQATVPRTSPAHLLSPQHRTSSNLSISSTRSAPVLPMCSNQMQRPLNLPTGVNLDYFPIGEGDQSALMNDPRSQYTEADWEQLLTNVDCTGQPNIYDGIYGGVSLDSNVLSRYATADSVENVPNPWAQEAWAVSTGNLQSKVSVPQSLLSFSEESLASGEDLVFSAAGSNNGSAASSNPENSIGEEAFKGIIMPQLGDYYDVDEYDSRF